MVSSLLRGGVPLEIVTSLFVISCSVLGSRAKVAFKENKLARCFRLMKYCVFLFLLWFLVMIAKDLGVPFLPVALDLTFILSAVRLLIKASVSASD